MDCSTPGFPVLLYLLKLLKLMSIESVMPSNHLILCHFLLLPPSIFPSIRIFSNESVLCIRWPKWWNFSFSISPSSECSGLISFRIDWLDLLAVQGTLKTPSSRHQGTGWVMCASDSNHKIDHSLPLRYPWDFANVQLHEKRQENSHSVGKERKTIN